MVVEILFTIQKLKKKPQMEEVVGYSQETLIKTDLTISLEVIMFFGEEIILVQKKPPFL